MSNKARKANRINADRIEVRKVAMLSTAHIPPAAFGTGLFVPSEEIWRLHGRTENHCQYYIGDDLGLLKTGLLPELDDRFKNTLASLVEAGITEVRFDADAPVYPEFAEFDYD